MALLDRSTGGKLPALLVSLIRFPGGIWQDPWNKLVFCLLRARELIHSLLQVLEEQPEGMVTVAIAAHYFSGEDKRSSQLDALKEKFPDWTFPSAWVCTYNLFVF